MYYEAKNRRFFLKGLGTVLSLPVLGVWGNRARAAEAYPLAFAGVYVPNGLKGSSSSPNPQYPETWTPDIVGGNYDLKDTLLSLADIKGDCTVLSGLEAVATRSMRGGDHGRAITTYYTGTPVNNNASPLKVAVSIDQIIANYLKTQSLVLNIRGGGSDQGWSSDYFHLSWKDQHTSAPFLRSPREVFQLIFQGGTTSEASEMLSLKDKYSKSVLDYVYKDANSLKNKLGAVDKQRLDQFLTSVRDVEARIQATNTSTSASCRTVSEPEKDRYDFAVQQKLLTDLQVLALECGKFRSGIFSYGIEGSYQNLKGEVPGLDVGTGWHNLSHWNFEGTADKKANFDRYKLIQKFMVSRFSYFVREVKKRKMPDESSLLDHCILALGSGLSDGSRHSHSDLPVILAGKGGGAIKQGRHLKVATGTPLANLWLTIAKSMGVPIDTFGVSDGILNLG